MFHRYIRIFALAFFIIMLCTGCSNAVKADEISNKTYAYEKKDFEIDFKITLNEDGTFSYCEGPISSYLGVGQWTLKGDILLLTDDGEPAKPLVNYFKVEGGELVFQSEKSSNFTYVKVADGERFTVSPEEE